MTPAPKPHDQRTPSVSVDEVRERYEQALHGDVDAAADDELVRELAQFEAAYAVLASALQDGE